MIVISGGRGIGKTRMLLEKVKEENGIVVCKDVFKMREKAHGHGIAGLNIISYEEFDNLENNDSAIYIHNMHDYLEYKNPNIKGYSVCNA